MVEVLYSSEAIRVAVRDLFRRGRGRRGAIVAFVGDGAEASLPRPSGLELYCWPCAPGTNPRAIRLLRKLGVDTFFVDRLHTKLYWASGRGAVVASSNLSTNAYGHGGLK